MAILTYKERVNVYKSSLYDMVYNYVGDYTYQHQCTIIRALLNLLETSMAEPEFVTEFNEEEQQEINRVIESANALLKPFNI